MLLDNVHISHAGRLPLRLGSRTELTRDFTTTCHVPITHQRRHLDNQLNVVIEVNLFTAKGLIHLTRHQNSS